MSKDHMPRPSSRPHEAWVTQTAGYPWRGSPLPTIEFGIIVPFNRKVHLLLTTADGPFFCPPNYLHGPNYDPFRLAQ